MKNFLRLTLIASVLAFLAACSSGVKLDDKPAVSDQSSGQTNTTKADPNAVKTVDTSVDPLKDPNGALAKRSVYFDLDSYIVKDDYRGVVEAHAKYLTSHRDHKVSIQGNADERGSSEYNLALGQKRAEAVRKQLALLGVTEAQMEAVSFGKEKPRALGHDEASWAENRRADIVYQ
jgi:peptidoglycan-associated lipoprotein